AHIFCTFQQLQEEVAGVLEMARFMMDTFGFSDYSVYLSTRPEKYAGELDKWEEATGILEKALEQSKIDYNIDPGEGVFYGPKIDIKFKDALEREWQGPTIQVDFNLPERFDVNYIGHDGKEHMVAMVHRTVLGSMERFMASLIEHYGGAFPLWLAPVQVSVIPVADRHLDYAHELESKLKMSEIRAQVDGRSERISLKIRQAQMDKIPYMLVVGDKEISGECVSVRLRSGEQMPPQSISDFITTVRNLIDIRSQDLILE
ncbi:MAG: threonine--tRNA ligase, partial [Dehalococcoidales bacterium]